MQNQVKFLLSKQMNKDMNDACDKLLKSKLLATKNTSKENIKH